MNSPSRMIRVLVALAVFSVGVPASAHADNSTDTTVAPDTTSPSRTTASTTFVPANIPYVPPVRLLPRVRIGSAIVVLDEQRVYVYSPTRRLIATLPVSTGLDDSTPTGSFRVFSKSEQAFFTPNPGERMKWMVRFTKGRQGDNIGFHGIPYKVSAAGEIPIPTPVGVRPVSHGCIRTRNVEAQWLFENMDIGTPVRVVQSRRG